MGEPGQRSARGRRVRPAAVAALLEDGYAGVRMEDIAERAGVHKTTIYRGHARAAARRRARGVVGPIWFAVFGPQRTPDDAFVASSVDVAWAGSRAPGG